MKSVPYQFSAAEWLALRSDHADDAEFGEFGDDVAELALAAMTHAPSCADRPAEYAAIVMQWILLLRKMSDLHPGHLYHLPIHKSHLNSLRLETGLLPQMIRQCWRRPVVNERPGECAMALTIYTSQAIHSAQVFHVSVSLDMEALLALGKALVYLTDPETLLRALAIPTMPGYERAQGGPLQNAECLADERAIRGGLDAQDASKPSGSAGVVVMRG